MRKLYFVLFGYLFSAGLASGQTTDEVQKLLIPTGSKEWVLDTVKEYLGTSCKDGHTYTFMIENKSGRKKDCVEEKWVARDFKWQLTKEGGDIYLTATFSKPTEVARYIIQFVKVNDNLLMRLRPPLDEKKELTINYLYR